MLLDDVPSWEGTPKLGTVSYSLGSVFLEKTNVLE